MQKIVDIIFDWYLPILAGDNFVY